MKRPAWLALACSLVCPGAPVRLAVPRRVVNQLYTTGTRLPNASLFLLDGQGQPIFTRIDNVQVSVEAQASALSLFDVPTCSIDAVRLDLSAVDINVVQMGQAGVLSPQVSPPGVKVWIVVEGIGR